MTTIPIVFTFDKRIVLAAAVAIKSLLETASESTTYCVYVIHPNLSESDICAYEEMFVNTRHSIEFIKVLPEYFAGLPKNNKSWTEIVYYRFLAQEHILNFEKVIYSDVDVLFKKDLSELYSTDITNCEFGAVRAERNTPQTIGHKYFQENQNEYIYWSGLLLMNLVLMRKSRTLQNIVSVAKQFNKRLKFFDLDAMNIACKSFKALPFQYVTLEEIYTCNDVLKCKDWSFLKSVYTKEELEYAKENPAIIHYAGVLGKPWHRKSPPREYQKYIDTIPNKLRRKTFRDLRKIFFSKL